MAGGGAWGEKGRMLTVFFSAPETTLKEMHLKSALTTPTSASSAFLGISCS